MPGGDLDRDREQRGADRAVRNQALGPKINASFAFGRTFDCGIQFAESGKGGSARERARAKGRVDECSGELRHAMGFGTKTQ
jgi:hypothetical protein